MSTVTDFGKMLQTQITTALGFSPSVSSNRVVIQQVAPAGAGVGQRTPCESVYFGDAAHQVLVNVHLPNHRAPPGHLGAITPETAGGTDDSGEALQISVVPALFRQVL